MANPIDYLKRFWTWYLGLSNTVQFFVGGAVGFVLGAVLV